MPCIRIPQLCSLMKVERIQLGTFIDIGIDSHFSFFLENSSKF